MFFRILRNDLKRKKIMNTVLLLFVILSAMFAASSANNMVSVYGGIDYFAEKAGMSDYIVLTLNENGSCPADDAIKRAKSVTDTKKEDIIYLASKNLKKDGKKYVDFENTGLSQEEYDRLSEIAPVVAYPEIAWSTTWQDETINDASALGLEDEGRTLVAETEELIAEKLSEYPDLEGKKVGFFWLSEDDLGTFYIYTNNDPRAAFLGDLGLVTSESVTNLIEDDTAFSITVSAENADLLDDVDIIITYGQESLVEAMQKDGRFSKIPAVNNGAFVLLDSNDVLAAASTPTVLSIPYCIDDYLKALNDAAAKIQ